MVMRFPAKKNAGCPKALRDFPPRKDAILHFQSGCLGTSPPPPVLRAYADVTTKFFGPIHYQISLAMELRWRALPRRLRYKNNSCTVFLLPNTTDPTCHLS